MFTTKLTQRRLMEIYDRVNKKPKTLLSENKLSAIYGEVNGPAVKFKKRTVDPFRIKQTLPTKKQNSKYNKNRQIIKTINVRRKSKYFTGKNRLMF